MKSKVAGYCKLCRIEEINKHGKLVSGNWHKAACKRAGCKHPPEYLLDNGKVCGIVRE